MIWVVFLLVILQELIQLEKSTIVRLYEKYLVDFRMFGYESQVIYPATNNLIIWNHLDNISQVIPVIIWLLIIWNNLWTGAKIYQHGSVTEDWGFFPFVFCKLNIFIFLVSVSENNTKNIQIEKIKTFHDVGHFSYFDSVWTVCFT